ncbi:O-antigen flippase, partial [Escherichia coli]|nr:O-antigen flippase [Escherichia coli]
KQELRKEILQGYKILLPIVIVCGLIIYLLRDFIIYLLFSDSFTPMKPLFTWQIIGDVFKIASWLLAYVMLAKAMTR